MVLLGGLRLTPMAMSIIDIAKASQKARAGSQTPRDAEKQTRGRM
jgi:hypothetical protein